MGEETSYWRDFKLTLQSLWSDFVWFCMPGTVIKVPAKEGFIVVGVDDRRWYDVGASLVEVWSDDPNDHYGPWLREHLGRKYINWQMHKRTLVHWTAEYDDIQVNEYVLIKIRDPHWATVATLALQQG